MTRQLIFFCPSIEEGGVEKNLILLANYLTKKNKIILVTANSNKKNLFNNRIKFICPTFFKLEKMPRLVKSIYCFFLFILYSNKFINKSIIISFESNIFGIILSRLLNKKIIIRSNASPTGYINNEIKKKIFKFFFKYADEIIVNSYDFKKQIDNILKVKSKVIYNSILDKKKISKLFNKKIEKIKIKKNTYKLLSVGRLVKQKDLFTLLKALNILKDELNFFLIIIGKGYLEHELKKYCLGNGLKNKVKFIGYKSNIFPYLKWSNALILTSIFEGLPNVLIEAISVKRLAISSNCPTGPREILINGKGGFLFKTSNYKELAKKIKSSYDDKKTSKKKVKIAFKSLHKYDFKKNVNKFKKIIENLY
tara:strand:- start:126 stop:1223 length:1098 start_codon:yes stop_codon:yes gene_type:complete